MDIFSNKYFTKGDRGTPPYLPLFPPTTCLSPTHSLKGSSEDDQNKSVRGSPALQEKGRETDRQRPEGDSSLLLRTIHIIGPAHDPWCLKDALSEYLADPAGSPNSQSYGQFPLNLACTTYSKLVEDTMATPSTCNQLRQDELGTPALDNKCYNWGKEDQGGGISPMVRIEKQCEAT
jgi:hypothetical protein